MKIITTFFINKLLKTLGDFFRLRPIICWLSPAEPGDSEAINSPGSFNYSYQISQNQLQI